MKKTIAIVLSLSLLIGQEAWAATDYSGTDMDSGLECEICCGESSQIVEMHAALLQRKSREMQPQFFSSDIQPTTIIPTDLGGTLMPSVGDINMLVLPISFRDYPQYKNNFNMEEWETRFFAPYDPELKFWEQSVRGYYYQASNGRLDITGTVLPVYEAPLNSKEYVSSYDLRGQLAADALTYYCEHGLDISKFDNDGDGTVDALVIHHLRPVTSYQGNVDNSGQTVGNYYQKSCVLAVGSTMKPLEGRTYEHEIGHLLGLLDNYKAHQSSGDNVLDFNVYELMSGSSGYINVYYKYLLGWIDPIILTDEDPVESIDLFPVETLFDGGASPPQAIVLIPNTAAFPFTEFYIIEYRMGGVKEPKESTSKLIYDIAPGIVIWHCNTSINSWNQYETRTDYLKPVCKSGSAGYSEKDIYVAGDEFSSDTNPNSSFYDGTHTGAYLKVEEITADKATVRVGFKDPDLLPMPIVEVSVPSLQVLHEGEKSIVTITTTLGGEIMPLTREETDELHRHSRVGKTTGTGVSYARLQNPLIMTVYWGDDSNLDNGAIWVDIPAGAIRYNGKDSPAVTSEKIYIDNTPPEITLQGDNPQKIPQGSPYTELGAVATDNLDPEIEGKLQIDSTDVNTDSTGTYSVIYSVTDHAGHTASIERTVIVEAHTHQYASTWSSDETSHWHECSCGDKADFAEHTAEIDPGEEATCTQPGLTEGSYCSVCDRPLVTQVEIPKKNHEISDEWHYGRIYEDGLGHWHECIKCQTMFDLELHSEDGGRITREPTLEEAGIRTYSCSVCGYEMRTEEIPKLEPPHTHSYPEQWSHDESIHWRECTVCHEKADQAAHTWDGGVVTTAPTSSKAGVKTYTCTVCKRTRTETVPATGGGGGSGGGSSGSSGSSTVTRDPQYTVTLPKKMEGGSVKAEPKKAVKGSRVTLTVETAEGYELEKLTIKDKKGKEVPLEEKGETYTFSMPGSNVEVTAAFRKAPVEEIPPSPPPKEEGPAARKPELPFTDVPEKAWYYDAVAEVYGKGLMTGVTRTEFTPELPASRGMVVTMLYRLEGEPPIRGKAAFSDISGKEYYAPAVAWATVMGIVKGYGDGTFRPNEGISREQLMTILHRYAERKRYDVTRRADLSVFLDAGQISAYARESMSWARAVGLLNGADWGGLDPRGTAGRGQLAAILERLIKGKI